jgi:hypothetical protein
VSSSHKNGHWGRGIANGLIVSLQSDGPGPYRYDMVNDISNTFAGGREITQARGSSGSGGFPPRVDRRYVVGARDTSAMPFGRCQG